MPETKFVSNGDNFDSENSIETDEKSPKTKATRLAFPFGFCRVCSDNATGIHYGIATCEGCKGFFKRSILRKEKYRCYFDNKCVINMTNRNRCKACRFRRCISEGMSVDGVKMGRIPKLVKERALRELREQQMKKQSNNVEGHGRESTCSSLSDRSVENYDPNPMETESADSISSPIQRQSDLTLKHLDKNVCSTSDEENFDSNCFRFAADFTVDETVEHSFEDFRSAGEEFLRQIRTIVDLQTPLNKNQLASIDLIRKFNVQIYFRYSKRCKQMIDRMKKLVQNGIETFPGENLSTEIFTESIRSTSQLYIRSMVLYIRQIPGVENLKFDDLHELISRRFVDFFLLKYHELFNENGQCYLVTNDRLQITRRWMNHFLGEQLSNAIFDFCRSLRHFKLNDAEMSLVLAYQMFNHDSNKSENLSLKLSYLRAIYAELCVERDENQAKLLCNRIQKLLEFLPSINAIYQRDVGSKILEI